MGEVSEIAPQVCKISRTTIGVYLAYKSGHRFSFFSKCPDFANLWDDFWDLSHPKKLDGTDGGFDFWKIASQSHMHCYHCHYHSTINIMENQMEPAGGEGVCLILA